MEEGRAADMSAGTYTFRTNVDLSAFDLSTVSIKAHVGADDDVLDVAG